jgi:hypothetical protein
LLNSSVVLKKELCYWNPDNKVGLEDYELWLRLRHQYKKFYNISEVLTYHRIHKKSFFNNTNNNYLSEMIKKLRKELR